MSGPLAGITVLSLAEQYPGPYCTLLLADLGAEVILVERPGSGDPARAFPDFFAAISRNKRSVCLDLKDPQAREDLFALAASADVLLEGYRPGTMARLGLGYEAFAARNPRLIYASISGFGQDGPYRDRPAHDLSYQAVTGLLFRHSRAAAPVPDVAMGDLCGGMFATVAVLAALHGRATSGDGTYIDVSMTDGLVSWMTAMLAPVLNGGVQFDGLEEPAYGGFLSADGLGLSLSIAHEDHFWRALCGLIALDAADLKHDERVRRRVELRAEIQARLARRDLAHWAQTFDRAGIPWGPVHDLAGVTQDPHFRARNMFVAVPRPEGGVEHHVAQPLKFSAFETGISRHTPALGEHTGEVLRKL
jgi:crotonobetainyl-CoA:carnitine CoA-transferase CaiB-like acyl-CoA transferase